MSAESLAVSSIPSRVLSLLPAAMALELTGTHGLRLLELLMLKKDRSKQRKAAQAFLSHTMLSYYNLCPSSPSTGFLTNITHFVYRTGFIHSNPIHPGKWTPTTDKENPPLPMRRRKKKKTLHVSGSGQLSQYKALCQERGARAEISASGKQQTHFQAAAAANKEGGA